MFLADLYRTSRNSIVCILACKTGASYLPGSRRANSMHKDNTHKKWNFGGPSNVQKVARRCSFSLVQNKCAVPASKPRGHPCSWCTFDLGFCPRQRQWQQCDPIFKARPKKILVCWDVPFVAWRTICSSPVSTSVTSDPNQTGCFSSMLFGL